MKAALLCSEALRRLIKFKSGMMEFKFKTINKRNFLFIKDSKSGMMGWICTRPKVVGVAKRINSAIDRDVVNLVVRVFDLHSPSASVAHVGLVVT